MSPRGGGYGTDGEANKKRLIVMGAVVGVLALVALVVWWPRGGVGPNEAPAPTAGETALGQLKEALLSAGMTADGEPKFSGLRWEAPKLVDGKEIITLNGAVRDKAVLAELNEIVKRVSADPSVVIDSKSVATGGK